MEEKTNLNEKSFEEQFRDASIPVMFAGLVLPAVLMITPFALSLIVGKRGRKQALKIVKKIIG